MDWSSLTSHSVNHSFIHLGVSKPAIINPKSKQNGSFINRNKYQRVLIYPLNSLNVQQNVVVS